MPEPMSVIFQFRRAALRGHQLREVAVSDHSHTGGDLRFFQKLLRKLDHNSVLFIKSIYRLGRNYDDLIDQWRYITKEKGADNVVIDLPVLDTRREK